MAKKKTKKNYILRRRVMRTMAAVTMAMAVAVASIPVERFGTMQAAEDGISLLSLNSNFDMNEIYKKDVINGEYDNDYFKNNLESGYTNEVTIQQIEQGGTVKDAYKADVNASNKGIVSGMGDSNNIEINEPEYYGFVMFAVTNTSLDNDLGINELKVTFDKTDTDAVIEDVSTYRYALDTAPAADLDPLTPLGYNVKRFAQTYTGENITLPQHVQNSNAADNSQGYDNRLAAAINQKDIVDNCEKEKEKADNYFKDTLSEYNKKVDTLLAIVEKLKKGPVTTTDDQGVSTTKYPTLTQDEVKTWNEFVNASKTNELFEAKKEYKVGKADLAPGKSGLKAVYEYIICQCYGIDSSKNLKNFELAKGNYKDSTVYLPTLKSELSAADGQYTPGGYLTIGMASMVGIKHETFKESTVESVEMPVSVAFIGAGAFEGCQNLLSVTVNTDGCSIIGDRAFADSALASITFTNTLSSGKLKHIGVNAFSNTGLKSIGIPASVTDIGAACFMKSNALGTVSFAEGGNSNVAIGEYAFYNCPALSAVNFEDKSKQYEIAKGAFALERDWDIGNGFEFRFPEANTAIDYNNNGTVGYDYILAGRANLKSVTFTPMIRGVIPANTLRGCYKLGEAFFETASASYDTYNKSLNQVVQEQLFSDVRNSKFMVTGPAADVAGENAAPRKSSWTGIVGYLLDGEWAPVPYKYADDKGEHIELGYRGGQYVAKIDVNEKESEDDPDTAVLASYTVNNNVKLLDERIPVTIPNEVGNYRIIEIGANCFQGAVKDKIYKITIEDGYVTKVGDGAFKGCGNLEWVYIGSPVTRIGADAFADCKRLENVVFSQIGKGIEYLGDEDGYWEENVKIGENAFATKSEHLTFYGAIHSGYAPFELAMGPDSKNMTSTGAHICYKSGEPKNLTVIRNEETGKATLVDYPHYDEIDLVNSEYIKELYGQDYSIQEAFEDFYFRGEENGFKETEIIKSVLNIDLPKGIDSIDTASDKKDNTADPALSKKPGFYKSELNNQDYFYVRNQYIFKEGNLKGTGKLYVATPIESVIRNSSTRDITKLYSTDKYVADSAYAGRYGDVNVARGGLFSGYFDEDGIEISRAIYETYADTNNAGGIIGKKYDGHDYTEDYNSGNDYITNVSMPTVDELPAYAFDSCENLMTAKFGSELLNIGALPFRNAKSIYNIDLGGNTKYAFKNMILYKNKGDDTNTDYEVLEMLEGRGKGGNYLADSVLPDDFLGNVSSIAPAAFANNTNVRNIDLSSTSVVEIPIDCFKNDTNLNKITFPSTIRQIDTGALVNAADGVELIIPTGDCAITADAVDGTKNVFITGVKYKTDGSYSNLWHSYDTLAKSYGDKVHFNDYGNTYHIEFVDKDMKTISTFPIEIKDNKSYDLDTRDIPAAPAADGLSFKYWMCKVGSSVYQGKEAGDEAFLGIKEDRIYYPYYESDPNSIVSEGEFKFEFENCDAMLGATALKSGDSVSGGATIVLKAGDESKFAYWSAAGTKAGDNANYAGSFQSSVTQPMTTFKMPNADVKVTANLKAAGGDTPGGSTPGGSTPGGSTPGSSGKKYKLTVNYGSGSGDYAAGTSVTISAFAPDSASKVFNRWSSSNASVGFASATSSTTSIVMPESDLTVTANYKTRVGSDDEDDTGSSSSRPGRPGSSTSTTAVTTTPSASTATGTAGTTGTVANDTPRAADNSGSKIYITKNGISNKDVASISVDGSTDNFIVRISESPEATAAAEESLINKYESLDGIAYFPMDISLYDSTGQNKITDTYGLNITVTMPIPDVLIQYGGNARAAACDNGNLQQLTPKFTTIDGIACISFVPPHFSPYVIYVDTNNLIAGQTLDQTPSTGDPIHPKWFLAMGMAGLSVVLFATSDGRRRKHIKTA